MIVVDGEFGCFVGRQNPLHLGHQMAISKMARTFGPGKCIDVIGSSNATITLRHFFSYEERRLLIKKKYPGLNVVGLPDYSSDKEWLLALDDLLIAAGFDPYETVFFGGCEEDISFFLDAGRKVHIVNRFDGSSPKVSATEVRDALIHNRTLDGLVDEVIQADLRELFTLKWEKFKKI